MSRVMTRGTSRGSLRGTSPRLLHRRWLRGRTRVGTPGGQEIETITALGDVDFMTTWNPSVAEAAWVGSCRGWGKDTTIARWKMSMFTWVHPEMLQIGRCCGYVILATVLWIESCFNAQFMLRWACGYFDMYFLFLDSITIRIVTTCTLRSLLHVPLLNSWIKVASRSHNLHLIKSLFAATIIDRLISTF